MDTPILPEQSIPDITVQSNGYLPDPEVKMSHNEWYAVSREMDFGTQIDKQTTSEITNISEQTTAQEITLTSDAGTTQEVAEKLTVRTDIAEPSSPDFFKSSTDVGDNPYRRRPPQRSPPTVVG